MRSHLTILFVFTCVFLTALSLNPAYAAGQKGPGHPKLDNALNAVATAFAQGGSAGAQRQAASLALFVRPGGRIPVVLEPQAGQDTSTIDFDDVVRRGGQVDAVSRSYARVLVPFGALKTLAEHPSVRIVRRATPAKALSGFGSDISESVLLTGAADAQAAGITGAGAKVAVVDLGFIGLADAIAAGELPATTVALDLSGTGLESDTEHGVGVAEHVMDMAPGATLYCLKVGDEVDLQNAADYLVSEGIDIANHSVGWVNSSYYDDSGPINAIVNGSYFDDGKFWAVAAGNDAERHWRGTWSDADGDGWLEFSGSDEGMDLSSSSSVAYIFLNWDQYGDSVTDLDLYVVDKRGRVVASSTGNQSGSQDPAEALAFSYKVRSAPYRIQIGCYAGPTADLDMTIFSFYNDLEYAMAANSFMDPADASGAFSVAAIDQTDWNGSMLPEPYSSQGPTNDGRLKPDIAAPDGTTSLTYGYQASFGTSFSSPTTAGAAALLLSDDLGRTAQDLADLLRDSAQDIGDIGWDPVYGYGKLHVASGPPNTPPVAADDGLYTVAEDSGITTLDVLANDSDPDGDPLAVSSVSASANGTASVIGGGTAVSYAPDANYFGADTFTYTVSDGRGGTDTATVTVEVTPVNDAPIADAQSVTTEVDTPVAISLSGSDADGDALAFAVVSSPAHGVLSGTAPDLTYTPDLGYVGLDAFVFEVSDGNGGVDAATVSITVEEPQVEPVIYVADIGMGLQSKGVNREALATVTVLDDAGNPVADAAVNGDWYFNGKLLGSGSAITGGGGEAALLSPKKKASSGDVFTFTVTDVQKAGCIYDAGQNTETSDSIAVP